jgi:hypothetical protein
MGITLVGIYAFLTAVAIIAASGMGDFKGYFVSLQLPLAFQMGLIMELMPRSLRAQFGDVSWTMAYLLIWPPTALVLYAVGSVIDYLSSPQSG